MESEDGGKEKRKKESRKEAKTSSKKVTVLPTWRLGCTFSPHRATINPSSPHHTHHVGRQIQERIRLHGKQPQAQPALIYKTRRKPISSLLNSFHCQARPASAT